MENARISIYTDGACSVNPGHGGYGIIIRRPDAEGNIQEQEYSQGYEWTTNNRMELTAVIKALEMLEEPCEIDLYSDSKYVIDNANDNLENWIKSGWKKPDKKQVKNIDLWKRFVEVKKMHTVTLSYVKAHADDQLNIRCDALAKAAADSDDLIIDEGYGK